MNLSITGGIRRPVMTCLALSAALTCTLNAQMTFEVTYGGSGPLQIEEGFRGAERVDVAGGCCDGGYIAVGKTTEFINTSCETESDVYVVRTDAMGGHVWEFAYNIGGVGECTIDEARCVREVQDGFLIAGTTARLGVPNPVDIFLMKVNCDGEVQFTQIYDGGGTNDFVNDMIITDFGNGTTTFPGDVVLAGWSDRGGVNQNDGLLIRTSSTGFLIWNKTYNALGTDPDLHNDFLNAVIETKASGAGDIVAVGTTDSWSFIGGTAFGQQGFVVRVNGNNGNFGPAPRGVAQYGGPNQEVFEGVTELTTTCEAGNLVFAGHTTNLGLGRSLYLVKTAPNPCTMLAQNVISSLSGPDDAAYDLVEVLTPGLTFSPVGNLAVVGTTRRNCDIPMQGDWHYNALLLNVEPSNLQAAAGFHFGSTFGCRHEAFRSVEDLGNQDPGFVMCGFTQRNDQIVFNPPVPDPSDLYLVKTGKAGKTGCEETWDFSQFDPLWDELCATAIVASPITENFGVPVDQPRDRQEDICVGTGSVIKEDGNPRSPGMNAPDNSRGGLQLDFSGANDLSLPSPLKRESEADKQTTTGTIRAKVKAKE